MCVLLMVGYVAVLQAVAYVATPEHGQAEIVCRDGKPVGAALIGQAFSDSTYFWSRPSAVDYDATRSGGSNAATSDPAYVATVATRVETFLSAHPYLSREDLPAEMVTASGSGLDPDISPRGAAIQVRRVAQAHGMEEAQIQRLVEQYTERPWLGLFGTASVNVLQLNMALDRLQDGK